MRVKMSKRPPSAPTASAIGPCPAVIEIVGRPGRGDQIFFSATCPGQVASKNPLVLRNFLLVPKYFSHCISFGQVVNTTISYSKCNSNQTDVGEVSCDL